MRLLPRSSTRDESANNLRQLAITTDTRDGSTTATLCSLAAGAGIIPVINGDKKQADFHLKVLDEDSGVVALGVLGTLHLPADTSRLCSWLTSESFNSNPAPVGVIILVRSPLSAEVPLLAFGLADICDGDVLILDVTEQGILTDSHQGNETDDDLQSLDWESVVSALAPGQNLAIDIHRVPSIAGRAVLRVDNLGSPTARRCQLEEFIDNTEGQTAATIIDVGCDLFLAQELQTRATATVLVHEASEIPPRQLARTIALHIGKHGPQTSMRVPKCLTTTKPQRLRVPAWFRSELRKKLRIGGEK